MMRSLALPALFTWSGSEAVASLENEETRENCNAFFDRYKRCLQVCSVVEATGADGFSRINPLCAGWSTGPA